MQFFRILKIFSFILLLSSCSYRQDAANPTALAPKNAQCKITMKKSFSICKEDKVDKTCLPKRRAVLQLSEVLDLGLKNNPETAVTWSQAMQAASLYGQSLAEYYPDINVIGSAINVKETLQQENLFIRYEQTTLTPEMQMQYVIFDFGQRSNTSKSALLALHYANYSHNREIETVMQTLISDYFDYLYQKEEMEAQDADLLSAKATLDAAVEKKKTGVASLADVVQAKTQYLQTKLSVISQKTDLETSYATLAKDMGIPANYPFTTEALPKKVEAKMPLQNLNTLIAYAKKHRQDFLGAEANKASKVYAMKSAQAEQMPVFSANFDIGKDYYKAHGGDSNIDFGAHEPYHYTAELKMSFPLFRGYYYKNVVKQTKAEVCEAEAQVKEVELNLIQQVTTAHFNLKMAKESLATSQEYLAMAKKNFDIALTNYKAGTDTILDVLSAQSRLADARSELASAKKGWFVSLANLAYATGSLSKQTLVPKKG